MELATVFLYVLLHDDNTNGERFRTRMPDMKTCMAAVDNAKISDPQSPGNSYEVMGVMWCGGEWSRNYGSQWHKDK